MSYRIEVADAPDNWSGDSNSRVIRYDLGGIEEEDLATRSFHSWSSRGRRW